MRTHLRLLPLVGLVAFALALSACAQPAQPTTTPQQPEAGKPGQEAAQPAPKGVTPKRGGTVTRFEPASFAGADPAMGAGAYRLWHTVGTFMLRREPDTWKLVGDAVERWEFSPDGLELTLHVRKGVKWQNKPPVNGRDVEARDIVYTLRSIAGLQYPELPPIRFPRKSNLDDMENAVVVDQYTVKVKLKQPSSSFLDGLAEYRSPITPDQIREYFGGRESLSNPSPERYLSAGPFILTSFQDTIEAVYSRYPDYWEKAKDGQSKPYLDAVRDIWIPDPGTANAAFMAGQVDFIDITNAETRSLIMGARKDTQIFTYEPSSCWYRAAYNMTRKPFDDVRIRRALSLVLDPAETGKTLYGDWEGKPLWRYPGPLPWSFPESLSQEELAKLPFYESPKSQQTIAEAKRLLAEAGISTLEFEVLSSATPATKDIAQMVVNQITRALPNVKVKHLAVDNALQLEKAAKGDFDVQAYCYIHEPTAVAMLKTAYHSKGGRNSARLNDAKMDDLLDRAGKEIDPEKRKQLLREAQLRVFDTLSMMPTAHRAAQLALQPHVRGIRLGGGTAWQMFSKEIWLDK